MDELGGPPPWADNELRMFYTLQANMWAAHRLNTDASAEEAEDIAKMLLTYPQCPLLIRTRALMILGCSNLVGYVEWAREAVRIAELGYSLATNPGPGDERLLANARQTLAWAEADFAETDGYTVVNEGQEQGGAEEAESTAATANQDAGTADDGEAAVAASRASSVGARRRSLTSGRLHTSVAETERPGDIAEEQAADNLEEGRTYRNP